jgi:membrane protein DedA with SNARE-associated domain
MLWRARIETPDRAWMPDFQHLLVSHGPWIIALAVAIDQLGIPIPSMPTLLLAGSLIASGDLSAGGTLAAATLASLPPDLLWFEIGRRRGHAVLGLLCRISLEPDSCVRTTRESFERRGPGTLLFAKFLPGLQTVAPPLAGAGGMGVGRFLAFDAAGALLFNAAFLLAGYLLQEQIKGFLEILSVFGARLLTVILTSIAVWIAWKFYQRQRFLHLLRVARIDVDTLSGLLEGDAPPIVYDLRDRLALEAQSGRVPGARVIRIDELDARHAEIPRDREIILYCA